jgi:hypothetical protein
MSGTGESAPAPDVGMLPVVEAWQEVLVWLLRATESFPKRARLSVTLKVEQAALAVLDGLVTAAFQRRQLKRATLDQVNLDLTRLRLFLRLARELRYLSLDSHEKAIRMIDGVGRQVGGWRASLGDA